MEHILIVTGGQFDIEFAQQYVRTLSFDKVFAVDKGLEYAGILGIIPDAVMGDFDTVKPDVLQKYKSMVEDGFGNVYLEQYPEKKDATDTELAVQYAITCLPDDITILGATGNRIDHLLMNLGLLLEIEKNGIAGQIVDGNNRIRLLDSTIQNDRTRAKAPYTVHMAVTRNKFLSGYSNQYLSVIPMSGKVTGLTLEGVLYPLTDTTVNQGSTLTVSNQITDGQADIYLKKGRVLVIEAAD